MAMTAAEIENGLASIDETARAQRRDIVVKLRREVRRWRGEAEQNAVLADRWRERAERAEARIAMQQSASRA